VRLPDQEGARDEIASDKGGANGTRTRNRLLANLPLLVGRGGVGLRQRGHAACAADTGDYRPAQAGITAEQAAVIFDRPELKNIPKRVVPFDYMWRIADVPPGQRRSWRPRPVHNTLN
jgi:hypothetical protein